jgi:folate-binding Fe-S cluster repair protein YgfZ
MKQIRQQGFRALSLSQTVSVSEAGSNDAMDLHIFILSKIVSLVWTMMMMMMISTMRVLPFVLLLLINALHVSAFSVGGFQKLVDYRYRSTALSSSTVIDYEYIPPDKNKNELRSASTMHLPSSYPVDTPAGLRGEAVRSALRSGQCIGWQLTETPLEFGVVSVKGKGSVAFLNNKLTQSFPASFDNTLFRQACLLTPKGRLIDRLAVAMTEPDSAYIFTSPGHSSQALFQRLDPFIFPLDQVTLKNECSSSSSSSSAFMFTLVSTKHEHLQSAFENQILSTLNKYLASSTSTPIQKCKLPSQNQCLTIPLDNNKSSSSSFLLIVPQTTLPECAATGYAFMFVNDRNERNSDSGIGIGIGARTWQHLVSDGNTKGPVEIGPLELETLRIEAGQAAYGHEITGADKEPSETAATPLELHYLDRGTFMDVNKGCYLGQEGIASVLKNPRGPPRTLYTVVFEDDFNIYDQEYESQGGESKSKGVDNLTRAPRPGDSLYVLGSNQEINIGALRSIAEPGGTGEPVTLGLALVRRADSILKRMKDMDLQIPRSRGSSGPDFASTTYDDIMAASSSSSGSGIIMPPPLDPLDGLEVIVGGTFTVGRLRMVPSRRLRAGLNMFVDEVPSYISSRDDDDDDDDDDRDDGFINVSRLPMTDGGRELIEADIAARSMEQEAERHVEDEQDQNDEDEAEFKRAMEEAAKAHEEAAIAETEAKRKVEKMEMLRKRAEDALAKRKQKKAEQ